MADDRRLEELTVAESLLLLGSVPVGRVVFTHRALPAIRPVNHLLAADRIIFRASLGAAITAEAGDEDGTVVAFEADQIDAASRIGWSVVVVGRACRVTSGAEVDHYKQALRPWAPGPMDDIIAIRTDLVTGFRLASGFGAPPAAIQGRRAARDGPSGSGGGMEVPGAATGPRAR